MRHLLPILFTTLALTACGGPLDDALDGEEAADGVTCPRCPTGPLPTLAPAPALDQSFSTVPLSRGNAYALSGELPSSERGLDELRDLDGNGYPDLVGFGRTGTWAVLGFAGSFQSRQLVPDFGYDQGWRKDRHVRALADVDGDGRLDVVGFGNLGVYTSRATATGYGAVQLVLADFGYDQGWRVELHERLVADVDGDHRADLIGYGRDGVWVARSNGAGFDAPQLVLADFGEAQGWISTYYVRTAGDTDGDGRADLVVFGHDYVSVARSLGTSFAAPQIKIADFGYNQGWRRGKHIRRVQDVNGDGRADVVAFGTDGVWVVRAAGGGYETPRRQLTSFGSVDGWDDEVARPRYVADLNGDGYYDVIGFRGDGVERALGSSAGLGPARLVTARANVRTSRLIGDLDRDGQLDAVWIEPSTGTIQWLRGTTVSIPLPPAAPHDFHVVDERGTAIDLAWTANSTDQTQFKIRYFEAGTGNHATATSALTTKTITGLHPGAEYCFLVFAENGNGPSPASPELCVTMSRAGTPPPSPTSGSFAITFYRQAQGGVGPAFYEGDFGPIFGARLLTLSRPPAGFGAPATTVVFPKAPFTTDQACNDPSRVVVLHDGATLGTPELTLIFGHAPAQGEAATLAACYGASDGSLPQTFFVNAAWGP